MPARILPTITQAEVQAHNSAQSCYVTIGSKVYDITEFVEDHPGGGDLILDYAGKDIKDILEDEVSHTHSDSAYEILDEHLVGFVANEKVLDTATNSDHPDGIVPLPPTKDGLKELQANGASQTVFAATGLATAEDLSRETDFSSDYKTHKFLDLGKPLLPQVWFGGFSKAFYLEQVHRPRHYKGGKSAPLFGNFLEPLSLTAWWVVPIVWLPPVFYGTYLASTALPFIQLGLYWVLGLCIWTLVEYILHRFLFHLDEYAPPSHNPECQLTRLQVSS